VLGHPRAFAQAPERLQSGPTVGNASPHVPPVSFDSTASVLTLMMTKMMMVTMMMMTMMMIMMMKMAMMVVMAVMGMMVMMNGMMAVLPRR